MIAVVCRNVGAGAYPGKSRRWRTVSLDLGATIRCRHGHTWIILLFLGDFEFSCVALKPLNMRTFNKTNPGGEEKP